MCHNTSTRSINVCWLGLKCSAMNALRVCSTSLVLDRESGGVVVYLMEAAMLVVCSYIRRGLFNVSQHRPSHTREREKRK